MKRIIPALVCILFFCPPALANDPWAHDTPIALHNGELRIVCADYQCRASFDGKQFFEMVGRGVGPLEIFEINGSDVVPLFINNGGNRCQHEYAFLTVTPDKAVTMTSTFALCGEDAKAVRKGDTVELKMRYEQKKPETFIWKNGVVTLKGKKVQ